MWQLDTRQRILWVAWAVHEGYFHVGSDFEPMFAGYVADRERLWGAKCLINAGVWWLPQLVKFSLLIPNESLSAFANECQTVFTIIERLSAESNCATEDVSQALQNMIRVAGEAQSNKGWVEIHSRLPPHPGIPQIRI
ncbi:MAG: hypothetical protein K8T25_13695 [Planctomycetia bacterium]|nr:hypothetical protein [Planctomycetia bacterium]